MVIETDESESEVSHEIIENDSDEASHNHIETHESTYASDEPPIEIEESEKEQQGTPQARGSLWVDTDVMSSTKIYGKIVTSLEVNHKVQGIHLECG